MIKAGGLEETGKDPHLWIKDIKESDIVRGSYLAKTKKLGQTKNGDAFLSVTLADRTGDIECRVWDDAAHLSILFNEGDVLEVEGHAGSYRNQVQLTLSSLALSTHDIDPAIFLETSLRDVSEMMRSLRGVLREIKDTDFKELTDRFLADRRFVELLKKAPAAKNFHHNYVGGLLEHTLSVCEMALKVIDQYPELNRDLLIAGSFLHDIGKIREFRYDLLINYTDEGRLLGHLVLGVTMIDEKLTKLKHFPNEKELWLKHLILSHHGQFEFGSPKRPKFLEAFALHLIDDLDAKINGIGRYMDKDKQGGNWTDFNRMFDRYLLKNMTQEVREEKEPTKFDNGQKALFSS